MSFGFASAGGGGRRFKSSLRPIPGQPGLFVWHGQIWQRVGGTAENPTLIAVKGGAAADPGVPVSSGGSYRPQRELGEGLSRPALGLLAAGVIGLALFAAFLNRDQYANPFSDGP